MCVVVTCSVIFTWRFLYCLDKNDFLSMVLFLMKMSFCFISISSTVLAGKVIEAAKVQNNGFRMLF